jgi:hypothetical protein
MRRVLALLVLALVIAPCAWPQASTGSVSGTVRDQSGAVIPGAAVVLTNTETNVKSRTPTNETGFYMLPGVTPGSYRLEIEQPGMQKFEVAATVQVARSIVIDPVLKPGQTSTTVEVQDVTPMVTVDSPALAHVLERARIEQLPINGRSLTSLLVTIPGMEGERAYGMRSGSQEMVLDGSMMADRLWGGFERRQPGLDSIQEFKVENNNSSAKYTRPTTILASTKSGTNQIHGSLFETNRNNGVGKARQRQDSYKKAPFLNRNEFGASAGGPVYIPKLYNGKDRTFWFFGYEALRQINPSTMSGSVPTPAMLAGDWSGLKDSLGRQYLLYDPWTTDPNTWSRQQFAYKGQPNVIDPARTSPLGKYLIGLTPPPTFLDVNPLVQDNFFSPSPSWTRQWTITTRVDHSFSDRDKVYGRYTQGIHSTFRYPFGTIPMLDPVPGSVQDGAPNRSLATSWTHTFSSTLFNELLVSGSREHWTSTTGAPGVKYADQLGLPNPLNVAGYPGIYDWTFRNYYFETTNPQASAFTFYILDDNATKIKGKHEFQLGFHFRMDQLNYLPDQQQPAGNLNGDTRATSLYDSTTSRTNPIATPFTGNTTANMFLGQMYYSNQFVRGYYYMRSKEYAVYFQDNFRVTPRLTLNLGLRWEYWPPYGEKNNVLTSFDRQQHAVIMGQDLDTLYRLGATIPSIVTRLQSFGAKFVTWKDAGLPQSLMNSAYKDFGPRLGFAYRAGDGRKAFVVRGGYRISYFPIPIYTWGQRMRQNPPTTARFNYNPSDAAQTPDGIGNYGMRSVPTIIAGQNSRDVVRLDDPRSLTRGSPLVSYFEPNQQDTRVQDWNLTFEKEVASNMVVRVGYIGNHVSHLEQYSRYNENPPDWVWYVTTGMQFPTGPYNGVARRPYDQQVYGTIEQYMKSGWSNDNGMQFELEHRYSKGYAYQIFYNVQNAMTAGGLGYNSVIPAQNQFLPNTMPSDTDTLNRLYNYQRDNAIPKHRVRWNWLVDLPVGKGKLLGSNIPGALDKVIGGWQVAGMGSLWSNWFSLPNTQFPTGTAIEMYGYNYPIQDCRSGRCLPGYLFWNGYINPNQINSVDANGKPNGVMGVPANYKPAAQPLLPWPTNPSKSDPLYNYYGGNTVWVPLKNGTPQRVTYDNGFLPLRQQYLLGPRQWSLDASLYKNIPIRERLTVRFNADFFNVLNHPNNPSNVSGEGLLLTQNSGSGARVTQLSLRLSW